MTHKNVLIKCNSFYNDYVNNFMASTGQGSPSSSLFFSCVGGALSNDALFCDTGKSTPLPQKSAKMGCSAGRVLARTFRGREGHKRLFRHQTYWHDVSSDHAIERCRAPQGCLNQTSARCSDEITVPKKIKFELERGDSKKGTSQTWNN